MKRMIFSILVLLVVVFLPAQAAAAEETSGTWGQLSWVLEDGTLRISGEGAMPEGTVPWDGFRAQITRVEMEEGVTTVSPRAFSDCSNLSVVCLADTVTEIGMSAFYRCESLIFVLNSGYDQIMPENLVSIGDFAFYQCTNLYILRMCDQVEYIGQFAFYKCSNLQWVVLSDSLKTIGQNAFTYCASLTNMIFPESLTEIGNQAFVSCFNIKNLYFRGGAPTIGGLAFGSSSTPITANVYYPANQSWNSSNMLNYGGKLTWNGMGEGILAANKSGDLNWVMYTDGLFYIYGNAKMEQYSYEVPAPWHDFAPVAEGVYIEDGVKTVGDYAFYEFMKINYVRFPNSLVEIGENAFASCGRLYWLLDGDLNQKLPDSLKTIGPYAFGFCNGLTSVDLGTGVTEIKEYAFWSSCYITQFVLPQGLQQVGDYAFGSCLALTNLIFGDEIRYIGEGALGGCRALKSIQFTGDAPTFHSDAFASPFYDVYATVYYPGGNSTWTADLFQNYGAFLTWKPMDRDAWLAGVCGDDVYWKLDYEGVITIYGAGPMYDYNTINYPPWYGVKDYIKEVVIAEGVTTVGKTAFYKCYNVGSISIAESVTVLGDSCFFDCDRVKTIYVSANVQEIGESTFLTCDALEAIVVSPNNPNYTSDEKGFLYNKEKTLLIKVPEQFAGELAITYGVIEIGYAAINGCRNITSVIISDTVLVIGNSAFSCCYNLEKVIIPANVRFIDRGAFWCCEGLQTIRFLGDAPEFSDEIFVNVSADAYYPAGNPTWTSDKFNHDRSDMTWIPYEEMGPVFEVPGLGSYYTMEEAMMAYDPNSQFIKLLDNAAIYVQLEKDLRIDLNGYTLVGEISADGYKIYGMDSSTNGYTCENTGYFDCLDDYGDPVIPETQCRMTIDGNAVRYLAVKEKQGYSFHRFYLGITHMNLKPSVTGFGYRAVFCGDEKVAAALDPQQAFGFTIQVKGYSAKTAWMSADKFVSGKVITLRIDHFDPEKFGETPVSAFVMLQLADGTIIESTTATMTFRSLLETLNTKTATLTTSQKTVISQMIKKYPIIKTWKVENF